MLMLPVQTARTLLSKSLPFEPSPDTAETEAEPFDPSVVTCWLSRGRSVEHATALAAIWRDYPELPASAPFDERMARGRERIAAMRPVNDAISARAEADRQEHNFAFTQAQVMAGKTGEREIAILRARDERGYDWNHAVSYADGWYAAHAGWNHRAGDTSWAAASRVTLREAYDAGFMDGGADPTDLFDAARRANLASLRADNQPRPSAAARAARPLPSRWPKPDDAARPSRWSRRLLIVPAPPLAEKRPVGFDAVQQSPGMSQDLMRYEQDGLLIVTLGSEGFAAGYGARDGCLLTSNLANAMIGDRRHGETLEELLNGREIDDILVTLHGDYLRVLDAFATAIPLCRTMARTRNSSLQQRAHLRCWIDRGKSGNDNIAAGHIRWGKAIKGLVAKLGEFTIRHAGPAPAPERGHLVHVEIANGHLARGYTTASGKHLDPIIKVSSQARLKREMTAALRAFGGATRVG